MQLTTTSYAILGLLDVRDWTAYDLAQQAERSLAFAWPVSQSQLYAEPKRLAAEGLITVVDDPIGPRRHRQVFSITAAGRRELQRWLGDEPAPPRLQMEALLRALLAPSGTVEDLVTTLESTHAAMAATNAAGAALVREYLAGDNPFPERLHANLLWMRFVRDFHALVLDWTQSSLADVARWDDAQAAGDDTALAAALRDFLPAESG